VALTRKMGCKPQRWVATEDAARTAGAEDAHLAGLPVDIGQPRSEWGLDLISERQVEAGSLRSYPDEGWGDDRL
jgi:hypothetical protein